MNREDLYKRFGPLLIEAVVYLMLEEINILRSELNLPERENQQLMNAINNKLTNLPKYDWMDGA